VFVSEVRYTVQSRVRIARFSTILVTNVTWSPADLTILNVIRAGVAVECGASHSD
jgi:hypothetical protein